jgi:hypothetical protein
VLHLDAFGQQEPELLTPHLTYGTYSTGTYGTKELGRLLAAAEQTPAWRSGHVYAALGLSCI